MTKGELRRARRAAREKGKPLTGELALPGEREIFTETAKGYRARWKWAKRYDALNGAPESDNDR
jgi:hypothetical protein